MQKKEKETWLMVFVLLCFFVVANENGITQQCLSLSKNSVIDSSMCELI